MSGIRRFRLHLYFLVGIQLVMALAAVSLLQRMAPAMNAILSENVPSLQAIEEMLSALSDPKGGAERFEEALHRANENITEAPELPLLTEVEALRTRAFAADANARAELVRLLGELGAINRSALKRQYARAEKMALGGSWALVLLGLVGLMVAMVVTKVINASLLEPIAEISDVMSSWRRGESRRRCSATQAPGPLRHAMESINQLLDNDRKEVRGS